MRFIRWLPILALLILAACQSAPVDQRPGNTDMASARDDHHATPRYSTDGPPDHIPPGLENLPDPVPHAEPKSARGNPSTYRVFGKKYETWDSAAGYYATGLASWYGRKFHGQLTSSGEPYDMLQLTAAHRSLPIPTYLRVTNLDNGRTTLVRVNDRGPFHSDRVIDLSFAAAYKLGFSDHGTAHVRLEAWAPADAPDVRKRADQQLAEQPLPAQQYVLQAGAFRSLGAADQLKAALATLTGERTYVVQVANDQLYRVRIGPVNGEAEAQRLRAMIVSANHGEPMIIRE